MWTRSVTRSSALGPEVEEGAMLSRPSTDQSNCFDMLAAKACSPGRDSFLFPRGTHAFAAGRARATTLFSEGRESMAPVWHSQSYTIGNATNSSFC